MPRDLGVRTRIVGGVGTWAVELGELPVVDQTTPWEAAAGRRAGTGN